MMDDDFHLLRRYAETQSEEAFATLVRRHLNLVYSVAWRHTRNSAAAEEIAQAVFIVLAQKAGSLTEKIILPGWLCRVAHHVSLRWHESERRRLAREQEAYMRSTLHTAEPDSDVWQQIEPILDAALAQLAPRDYDAVVLRFFNGKSFQEIGAAQGTSEDAAKKRMHRALAKLQTLFRKRGISLTAGMIATAVGAHSVQAAPDTLAAKVTMAATSKTVLSSATLAKGIKLMAWSKTKIAACSVAALLLLGGATVVSVEHQHRRANSEPLFIGPLNPGAENGAAGWLGWYWGAFGTGTTSLDHTDPFAGENDFTLGNTQPGVDNRSDWRCQQFSLQDAAAGKGRVTLSFRYKIPGEVAPGEDLCVFLRFYDSTRTNIPSQVMIRVGSKTGDANMTDYKSFELRDIRVPLAARTADVRVTANHLRLEEPVPWTSGIGRFDDFSVTASAAP